MKWPLCTVYSEKATSNKLLALKHGHVFAIIEAHIWLYLKNMACKSTFSVKFIPIVPISTGQGAVALQQSMA